MSSTALLRRSSSHTLASTLACQTRSKSSSPYGRSHLRKAPSVPNPTVPLFRQRAILSDGSTFTHFTTSPRSVIRLTRDLTNNPFWSPSGDGIGTGDELSGRMGRFAKRFGGDEEQVSFENVQGPLGVQAKSNALAKAAQMNLGGKYKATKVDGDDGKGKKK